MSETASTKSVLGKYFALFEIVLLSNVSDKFKDFREGEEVRLMRSVMTAPEIFLKMYAQNMSRGEQ